MTPIRTYPALLATGLALAGCEPVPTEPGFVTEAPARAACIHAVRRDAQTVDVAVLTSRPVWNGTEVILQVGPFGRWHCLAFQNGAVGDVYAMAPETVS